MSTYKLGGFVKFNDKSAEDFVKFSSVSDSLKKNLTELAQSNKKIDLRKYCSPIENQADIGSCVGNAVVSNLEFLRIKKGLKHIDLSRMFIYYNARLMHKAAHLDNGTHINLAFGTLSAIGTCIEKSWAYNPNNVFVRPSWNAYREAFGHKINAYYNIDSAGNELIEEIKDALKSQLPVVFGVLVDETFQKIGSDGLVQMPKKTRVNVGGHAMMIVGYDDDKKQFIVRNSWGTSWGDKGYCYMPYEYLLVSDASDFWVATDLE